MFFICLFGPTMKEVLASERTFPSEYLMAKGAGYPVSNCEMEKMEVMESANPRAKHIAKAAILCLSVMEGQTWSIKSSLCEVLNPAASLALSRIEGWSSVCVSSRSSLGTKCLERFWNMARA